MARLLRSLLLAGLLSLVPASIALAHQDGCHVWHACNAHPVPPPDFIPDPFAGYVCGDLGYNQYCEDDPARPIPHELGTRTTVQEFVPPPPPISQPIQPPPPAPPFANPMGALDPPEPPRPPIQVDCSQDRLTSQA